MKKHIEFYVKQGFQTGFRRTKLKAGFKLGSAKFQAELSNI